jgi:lysozyme
MTPENIEKLKTELKRDEGLRLSSYRCSMGHQTIGYGHNLQYDSPQLRSMLRHGITELQAERLLETDISKAIQVASGFVRSFDDLTDGRKRALVNMAFNLGYGLYEFVKLKQAILASDWDSAAREVLDSRYAKQVGKRAERVAKLLKSGN